VALLDQHPRLLIVHAGGAATVVAAPLLKLCKVHCMWLKPACNSSWRIALVTAARVIGYQLDISRRAIGGGALVTELQ